MLTHPTRTYPLCYLLFCHQHHLSRWLICIPQQQQFWVSKFIHDLYFSSDHTLVFFPTFHNFSCPDGFICLVLAFIHDAKLSPRVGYINSYIKWECWKLINKLISRFTVRKQVGHIYCTGEEETHAWKGQRQKIKVKPKTRQTENRDRRSK